ncbi:MAG TPA: DUF4381 domain-containing protein [Candidatus Competibacteraceae bacterium]|nr:DUF4381 domain-containing protein [Candidatus Competibacteraceae bacterium]HQA26405.1 DUF4381 domain-containing protein [Candidatus Competibacteraceae bacterium]HQD56768.1 DUF4381 domain-containing protein [Candidatus Competibacteraceae bacterium]
MTGNTGVVQLTSHDALTGLADIVMPKPVSWVPQTWGWWVLAGVLCVAALGLGIYLARRFTANRYRREALKVCAALDARLDREDQRATALAGLAVLLKRTALSAWPRAEVASLFGHAWIDFLRRQSGHAGIDERMARLLDDAEYRPEVLASLSPQDAHACARAVRLWIESHRVPT